MSIFDEVRTELKEQADIKYRKFNSSIVPGNTSCMIGVRLPKLRKIARRIAECDVNVYQNYIEALREAQRRENIFHEELLLYGMLIGYLKCDDRERKMLLDDFVPMIDNWAVCDSSCATYKFMKKDMDAWYQYLMKYIYSDSEYEIRFAVVCLLDYFIIDDYIDRVISILGQISHEAYYVKMAVAWAVSVCYVKYPQKTRRLLDGGELDNDTYKKALQKIRDSYRVTTEEKEKLYVSQ